MSETTWIYHERQEAALCGLHALNNLLQEPKFSPNDLLRVALAFDQKERALLGTGPGLGLGSHHYDNQGNFSSDVLREALKELGIDLERKESEEHRNTEATTFKAFICHKDNHWFAIRKVDDRYYNLDSKNQQPEVILGYTIAAKIAGYGGNGYTVFIVTSTDRLKLYRGLDPIADNKGGQPEHWWNAESLHKGTAINGSNNPWSGRAIGNGNKLGGNTVEDRDEDEEKELRQALINSMPPVHIPKLTPEPEKTNKASVVIKLKLPGNKTVMRRFLKSEDTGMIHAFIQSRDDSPGVLQLTRGYPPFEPILGNVSLSELGGSLIRCKRLT